MVMIHLMTGKVMIGQGFIDLTDPQEKMRRLNSHYDRKSYDWTRIH